MWAWIEANRRLIEVELFEKIPHPAVEPHPRGDGPDAAQRWLARETLLDLIPRLNVPVLAVPPGFTELPRSVIVAIDFSKYSLEIAREALEQDPALIAAP